MDVDGAVEDGGRGWLGTWGDCLRAVRCGGEDVCLRSEMLRKGRGRIRK